VFLGRRCQWAEGDCMKIGGTPDRPDAARDPDNDKDPVRMDRNDSSVPHRRRATELLPDVA
jgi:hypothetical protein